MKQLSAVALSLAAAAAASASLTTPAEAGLKRCVYMAHHVWSGYMVADGWAWSRKRSWACNRASRRCNRERDRRLRDGVPAGPCRKIQNLS